MNQETSSGQAGGGLGVAPLLADLQSRLQNCNNRKRALLALPPLKHDMTLPMPERLDTFERLQSERVSEDISIMSETLGVMKQLDVLMSANTNYTAKAKTRESNEHEQHG